MQLIPTHLPSDVHWGFTREGLKSVLHHAHPIPVSRGFTSAHMSANWPGLTIGAAIAAAKAAGALSDSRAHFSGYSVRRDVEEFHILHDGTGRVVRRIPTDAHDPNDHDDEETGGFLTDAETLLAMSREELRELLAAVLQRGDNEMGGR